MYLSALPRKHPLIKSAKLLTVGLLMTILTILVGTLPAFADTGGYPWYDAITLNASTYDWGYSSCPSTDTGCMAMTYTLNNTKYGEADPWVYYLRNCTSYVAWKINAVYSISVQGWGNATDWDTSAGAAHYNVYPGSSHTPVAGEIAQWEGTTTVPQGHVAYVDHVTNGIAYLDEYNVPGGSGNFSSTSTTASNSEGTPDHYIHIGTATTSSPGLGGGGASSWASGRFDAWIEQASPINGSNLGHLWFNGAWQPWETIGAPNNELMASQPAAVSWSYGTTPNRIDVFARGQAGDLIHAWYDGTQWYPWESLGGCVEGSPTVTSWGPGRLDVFVEGCNTTGGNLWHTWYDSTGWHAFENIATNMVMTASPSAVAWGPNRIDIFSRGTDSSLTHTFFDGSWHNWESLGGCIVGSPATSSWVSGRVDAWIEGCDTTGGNFYQTWWSAATGWSPFNKLSSTYRIYGVLGAVSWGSNRIDMFTRASDNSLDHWWFDGTSFQGPENKGGVIAP